MTEQPSPWEKTLKDIGEQLQSSLKHAGNVAAVQTAIDRLMQGDRTRAAGLVDSLPADALQPVLNAVAELAELLMLKARTSRVQLEDPFEDIPRTSLLKKPASGA